MKKTRILISLLLAAFLAPGILAGCRGTARQEDAQSLSPEDEEAALARTEAERQMAAMQLAAQAEIDRQRALQEEAERLAAEKAAAEEEKRRLLEELGAVSLTPKKEDSLTLTFAGDIIFETGQNPGASRAYSDGIRACFDQAALEIMESADLFIVNNEFQYTDRGAPIPGKTFTFRCPPYTAAWLAEIGTDLVTLANNHIFDYGEEGFLDTLDTLDKAGMPYIGAGRNLKEAARAAYYEADGMVIAILNASEIERYENPESRGATEDAGGVFRCLDDSRLCEEVRKAKERADFVIVTVHWGTELMTTPDDDQLVKERDLREAGCDLIVGGHPHVLQTIGWKDDMPCVYSLGNYFFSASARDTGVVQVTFTPSEKKMASLRFVPMLQNYGVQTLTGSEKDRLLSYMRSLSPEVSIDGDGYISKAE